MKADIQQVSVYFDEIKKSISFINGKIDGDIYKQVKILEDFARQQKFINDNICPLNCLAQF